MKNVSEMTGHELANEYKQLGDVGSFLDPRRREIADELARRRTLAIRVTRTQARGLQ